MCGVADEYILRYPIYCLINEQQSLPTSSKSYPIPYVTTYKEPYYQILIPLNLLPLLPFIPNNLRQTPLNRPSLH